ncbi:MAG: exodeoxyribonuclease VII small subunit [Methylophilaceae bacterium]
MQNKNADTPLSYETAIAELESIVTQMESEKLSLEQSLNAYKRGAELLKICQQSLVAAEQQIQIVSEENKLTDYSQD